MSEAAEKDLYAVLGASSSDSVHQLKHRYQQLALQYHPDRLRGERSLEVESGVKKFLEVDAAWRILRDQNTRRQYDLQRRAQELKQDLPVDSTVYLEDMTWDQGNTMYIKTHMRVCTHIVVAVEEATSSQGQKWRRKQKEDSRMI
ncbi:dnaJ homolog subfamily C member 24 isoform X2 [Sparus aurata]|uniref:dnaJ homolog subfamily C member 24 isoform X2 n=1 Tax=Sparus aurata TaxID=8175 RepID=UPI0011C1122F|nr:dnaJ homolog subfamily C member 24 isoform X2 [Sparus aurata]